MKLKNVQTPKFRKAGYAVAFTLLLCLLLCLSLVRVGAQKAQKRITSIWTATGAEGSRVTLASDTQLNDYEAYTRGDRFYVKIPLADLPSTTGSLLGRGFDDVQLHRVGDGILLSFRLQPGTTARVDQKLNRIEIVFSIPVRSQSSGSMADRSEVANRTRVRTIRDAAGPKPPVSAREEETGPGFLNRHEERGERTTGSVRRGNPRLASEPRRSAAKTSASESNKQKSLREKADASSLPRASSTASANQPHASESPTAGKSFESKGSTTKGSVPSANPSPSPSPIFSPSPVASPSSSLTAASPSGTPLYAAPVSQQPSASASPIPASNAGTGDWSSRLHYLKTWARYNPWPLLIFGLVLVALLLLLFVRGGRRHRPRDTVGGEKSPATPATGPGVTTTVREPGITDPAGAAAGQRGAKASSESSIRSPAAHASEDPDREVFEL